MPNASSPYGFIPKTCMGRSDIPLRDFQVLSGNTTVTAIGIGDAVNALSDGSVGRSPGGTSGVQNIVGVMMGGRYLDSNSLMQWTPSTPSSTNAVIQVAFHPDTTFQAQGDVTASSQTQVWNLVGHIDATPGTTAPYSAQYLDIANVGTSYSPGGGRILNFLITAIGGTPSAAFPAGGGHDPVGLAADTVGDTYADYAVMLLGNAMKQANTPAGT